MTIGTMVADGWNPCSRQLKHAFLTIGSAIHDIRDRNDWQLGVEIPTNGAGLLTNLANQRDNPLFEHRGTGFARALQNRAGTLRMDSFRVPKDSKGRFRLKKRMVEYNPTVCRIRRRIGKISVKRKWMLEYSVHVLRWLAKATEGVPDSHWSTA